MSWHNCSSHSAASDIWHVAFELKGLIAYTLTVHQRDLQWGLWDGFSHTLLRIVCYEHEKDREICKTFPSNYWANSCLGRGALTSPRAPFPSLLFCFLTFSNPAVLPSQSPDIHCAPPQLHPPSKLLKALSNYFPCEVCFTLWDFCCNPSDCIYSPLICLIQQDKIFYQIGEIAPSAIKGKMRRIFHHHFLDVTPLGDRKSNHLIKISVGSINIIAKDHILELGRLSTHLTGHIYKAA